MPIDNVTICKALDVVISMLASVTEDQAFLFRMKKVLTVVEGVVCNNLSYESDDEDSDAINTLIAACNERLE